MSTVITAMGLLLSAVLPVSEWAQPTQEASVKGLSTYYRAGLMDEVAINRGLDLDGYISGVALNRAGDLGRVIWLEWDDGSIMGPFLVVDCAQRIHFDEREQQGRVVEVPAWVARLQGFYGIGPIGVVVWFDTFPIGNVLEPL